MFGSLNWNIGDQDVNLSLYTRGLRKPWEDQSDSSCSRWIFESHHIISARSIGHLKRSIVIIPCPIDTIHGVHYAVSQVSTGLEFNTNDLRRLEKSNLHSGVHVKSWACAIIVRTPASLRAPSHVSVHSDIFKTPIRCLSRCHNWIARSDCRSVYRLVLDYFSLVCGMTKFMVIVVGRSE